jgi:hypothetical protein
VGEKHRKPVSPVGVRRRADGMRQTLDVSATSGLPVSPQSSTQAATPHPACVALPPTFRAAVRGELARAVRPPFEVPLVVLMNAALVTGAWFLLPRSWFFDFTRSAAFPVALAAWMYADVPATNVLAPNRALALAALNDSPVTDWQVLRLLRARLFTLWLLVTPPALIVAVITGWHQRHWMLTVGSMIVIFVVPFGMLAPSGCIGVRYPYHPRSLTWRWRRAREDHRSVLRYTILVLTPYVIVPAIAWLALVPAGAVWFATEHRLPLSPVPIWEFVLLMALTCATSAALWVGGHRAALRIVARRRGQLVAYLADPERG